MFFSFKESSYFIQTEAITSEMLIADTCISILWDLVLRGQQLELKSLPSVPLDAAVVYPQEREQVQSRNLRKMPEFYCNTIWPQCNLDGDVWSKAERLMQLDLGCKILQYLMCRPHGRLQGQNTAQRRKGAALTSWMIPVCSPDL